MKFHIVLWTIGTSGALSSWFAWRVEAVARRRAFRWGGWAFLAGWVALLLQYRPKPLARMDLLCVIAACVWWLPFAIWILLWKTRRRRGLTMTESARTSSAFREARTAATRKEYKSALLLYHQAAALFPEGREPRLCMGELFLLVGMPDDALASFRDAEKLQRGPDDKLPAVFAIAETLMEHKKDVPAAIQVIQDFLAKHPDITGRPFAEGRIEKMRALLTENPAART